MIQFSSTEVQKLQAQLKEIDEQRKDGKFVSADGSVLAGSDEVADLLQRCLLWSEIVLERQVLPCPVRYWHLLIPESRKGEIPEAFQPRYRILVSIRNELDKLSITPAWSLREADLYDYQRQLDRIDESRVDGNFLDDEGKPAELYVQRVGYTIDVMMAGA